MIKALACLWGFPAKSKWMAGELLFILTKSLQELYGDLNQICKCAKERGVKIIINVEYRHAFPLTFWVIHWLLWINQLVSTCHWCSPACSYMWVQQTGRIKWHTTINLWDLSDVSKKVDTGCSLCGILMSLWLCELTWCPVSPSHAE